MSCADGDHNDASEPDAASASAIATAARQLRGAPAGAAPGAGARRRRRGWGARRALCRSAPRSPPAAQHRRRWRRSGPGIVSDSGRYGRVRRRPAAAQGTAAQRRSAAAPSGSGDAAREPTSASRLSKKRTKAKPRDSLVLRSCGRGRRVQACQLTAPLAPQRGRTRGAHPRDVHIADLAVRRELRRAARVSPARRARARASNAPVPRVGSRNARRHAPPPARPPASRCTRGCPPARGAARAQRQRPGRVGDVAGWRELRELKRGTRLERAHAADVGRPAGRLGAHGCEAGVTAKGVWSCTGR